MDDFTKNLLIEFISSIQELSTYEEKNIEAFIELVQSKLEEENKYNTIWDKSSVSLIISNYENESTIYCRIVFEEPEGKGVRFHLEPVEHFMQDETTMKAIGTVALFLLAAHTEWETEILPMYVESLEQVRVEIALSLTEVELTEEERDMFSSILQRMAKDSGLSYEHILDKSFELELRGFYSKDSPLNLAELENEDSLEEESEEESSSEWI